VLRGELDALVLAVTTSGLERIFEGRPGQCRLALALVAVRQVEQGAARRVKLVAGLELGARLLEVFGGDELARFVVEGLRYHRVLARCVGEPRPGQCQERATHRDRTLSPSHAEARSLSKAGDRFQGPLKL
jgi:hypothetical protein